MIENGEAVEWFSVKVSKKDVRTLINWFLIVSRAKNLSLRWLKVQSPNQF